MELMSYFTMSRSLAFHSPLPGLRKAGNPQCNYVSPEESKTEYVLLPEATEGTSEGLRGE